MQTKTDSIEVDARNAQVDWAPIRTWAEKAVTKDRITDMALASANVVVAGAIMASLYKAMQIATYTGIGNTAFGGF